MNDKIQEANFHIKKLEESIMVKDDALLRLQMELREAKAELDRLRGERGDGGIYEKVFVKDRTPTDLKYYHTNDGTCRYSEAYKQWLTDANEKRNPSYWLEPLPHPSTKEFSREDMVGFSQYTKSQPSNIPSTTLLQNFQSLTPSSHTEVKDQPKGEGEGIAVEFTEWAYSNSVRLGKSKWLYNKQTFIDTITTSQLFQLFLNQPNKK